MPAQPRKPLKWVGSSKRDLDGMPEDVKDLFGHAIDLAQAGGKATDAVPVHGMIEQMVVRIDTKVKFVSIIYLTPFCLSLGL